MYTVSEDEDDVQVCIRILTGTLAGGVTFEFNIQTVPDSAYGMRRKEKGMEKQWRE